MGCALYKVRSLAAAKVQVKVFKGLAANWRTGLAPISGIGLGVRLNRIGVALQALARTKFLGVRTWTAPMRLLGHKYGTHGCAFRQWVEKRVGNSLPERCGAADGESSVPTGVSRVT